MSRRWLVPLINGAERNVRWFIEDVWGQFDHDHTRVGSPLFPSERKNADRSAGRATADVYRRALAAAAPRTPPRCGCATTPSAGMPTRCPMISVRPRDGAWRSRWPWPGTRRWGGCGGRYVHHMFASG
jgi:hypothetical protein